MCLVQQLPGAVAHVVKRFVGEAPGRRDGVIGGVQSLLGKVAGVDGLKTGFTNGAGFCLSATALRNGKRIIVVVMGSAESKTRDLKVAELIERGFAALPPGGPAFAGSAEAVPAPEASPVSAAPVPEPTDDGSPAIKFAVPPAKK